MANTKAFTHFIGPTGSGEDEDGMVTQTSPTWVLTFVRWEVRDPLRTPGADATAVRQPLVVENDCLQVSVALNKGVLTPSMMATLVETDVNYETQIAPGDFVFVNMLNWEEKARNVADRARAGQPINEKTDGFKGMFKVQGVRKIVDVDPNSGVKTVLYKINGFAFTEFNNTIYFNPNLINQKSLSNQALFISDISTSWASLVSKAGKPFVQEVIAFLIQSLIGSGVNPKAAVVDGLTVTPNVHFMVPKLVGRLLGVSNSTKEDNKDFKPAIAAKDIYLYIFGIQKYASGSSLKTLAAGMTPSNLKAQPEYPQFYYTNEPCQGNSLLKPEYWNQVKLWSILNQYTNAPLNELYSCFRISRAGRVMPTLVFRQIPFTSEDFVGQSFGTQDDNAASISVTKFLDLPRWKIGSESIFSVDLGRDEAARINFVQYYAKSNFSDKGIETSGETALGNYVFDQDDISRSGLRPYVVQNQFDDLPDALIKSAPVWARILGDAVIGGHLKLNGTIVCIGIVDPIAIGDNLEFDGVVYHIEQVAHTCSISPANGIKSFRTTLSLSHGVSANSNANGTKYAHMTYADGYQDRAHDAANQEILPGVSESQDVVYRDAPDNPDFARSVGSAFVQPTTTDGKVVKGE